MYFLPDGRKTTDWEAFNKAWRKLLTKYAKTLGLGIESVNGDCVTFGNHVMRANGKPALVSSVVVPKTFVLASFYAWQAATEELADMKGDLDSFEFEEDPE